MQTGRSFGVPNRIEHITNKMQAAIYYANLGWRIFPLTPGSKIPLFKESWVDYASNNPNTVRAWWTAYPDANIACVTDQFTVIDVDRKPGKPDGWLQVGAFLDQETPWATTANGGYHFLYKDPGVPLRSLPGVDVLRGNHYFLLPPSTLDPEFAWENPKTYRWGKPVGFQWDPGLREMPAELLAHTARHPGDPAYEHEEDYPGLLEALPSIPRDELKEAHRIFLRSGEVVGFPSRSEIIHSIATRLFQLGYEDIEVLSMLWNEDQVQWTASQHRADHERALEDWLWKGVRKLRHHRLKRADEVFTSEATSKHEEIFKEIRNNIMRLSPTDDIKPTLQQLAGARFHAVDEEDLLGTLCAQTGRKITVLRKTLVDYKKLLVDTQGGVGPQWKHTTGDHARPLPTVENLAALLAHKGATVEHNQMTHRVEVNHPQAFWGTEEPLNNQLTCVRSWAAEFGMPMDPIAEQLVMLARTSEYHPFKRWVEQVQWDGFSRLETVLNTIHVEPDKEAMKRELVRKWLISIVAAVWGYGNRAPRGVLTFTGPQQIGKTTWLRYLVPEGMYQQGLILRADQRDSAVKGLRSLIAEIGEIGTTFRRQDIESLKNYIGQREDRYRLPYAREESTWMRRTVFAASANDQEILHDQSGNTRWWVIPVTGFNLDTMELIWGKGWGGHLQQLWAEVLMLYHKGESWDLTDKELNNLELHLADHKEETPIESMLRDAYAWEDPMPAAGYNQPKREMDILRDIGLGSRTLNPLESRQLRDALRRLTGQRMARKRRLDLAAVDGESVLNVKVQGRWWFMPPLMNNPMGAPHG